MAEYLILIYEDEAAWTRAGDEAFNQTLKAHGDFIANNSSALHDGGAALWGSDTATSIRKDAAGGFTVTDGPFAETKEGLGGLYKIEAASLDEAIEIAKQVPAPFGGVEVRPIRVFD